MEQLNTYLNFNGNTEEVFNFYKSVFGGEFVALMRFKDTPGCENMPEADQQMIMHIALQLGKSVLMGTDVPESMEQVRTGTNMSICINAESREEADKIFSGLAQGGKIQMPLQDMFWGDYYGMLTDQYEIQWMISHNPNR
ncbi:MAG: VOC family protein [Bacteroidota bacterium]